jgi:AcrR family transcriptional regulator
MAVVHRKPGRPRNIEPSAEYQARIREIVNTAADVFRSKGYDAGSLDDVADALGLRKSSLYYYVGSKRELLYLICDRAISISLERARTCLVIDDPRERLAALIRHQVMVVGEEPNFFSVVFDRRPALAPAREAEIRAKERQYLEIFAKAVAAGVDAGVIPPVEPRYGAQAVMGMASWVYKWFKPERDDIEAFAATCARLVLGGGGVDNTDPNCSERGTSEKFDQPVSKTLDTEFTI